MFDYTMYFYYTEYYSLFFIYFMKKVQIDKVVMRFVGDSGDGIQIIGNQLADSSVIVSGNDVYTFVDFPSEIRAPAGSLSGVSGFQVSISSKKIYTIGDEIDLLVAFNPAALKTSYFFLKKNGFLIIDIDSFSDRNFKKAGFLKNPLEDSSLESFKLFKVPVTKLTYECVKDILLSTSKAKRCKNFFALGFVCWLYDRDLDHIISWLKKKFKVDESIFFANKTALLAGYNYANNLDLNQSQIYIPPISLYKSDDKLIKISGNKAFVLGAIATSFLMDLPLFSANYPITPASDVLHDLLLYSKKNMFIVQLEDEIAAINAVIGASYGGALAFTCTSGPGLDLMQESLGLAIMAELPLLLLDIQRSGPSTGIPTKSEQTDLVAAVFGRHGESRVIVLAPNSPSDCFWTIIEGFCLAILSLSPVIILSDANLANSAELWCIPSFVDISGKFKFDFSIFKKKQLNYVDDFSNLIQDEIWISPGKKGFESCIGGLERDFLSGNVSHCPLNHFNMVINRFNKLHKVVDFYMVMEILGNISGDILLITWGSVFGIVRSVYDSLLLELNCSISLICLRYLYPLPKDLSTVIFSFNKVIVIEENMGQLAFFLRSVYLVDVCCINQVSGKPFEFGMLKTRILNSI